MRIFIDIGHPAHVHYFKNFIKIMKSNGHVFFITARDKEVSFQLLNHYKFNYQGRGRGGKGFIGKMFYILKGDKKLYSYAKKFKPDIFISFASPYAAHVAFLMRKPHIAFDDTDHAFFSHLLQVPFSSYIVTPKVYMKDFGEKHIRFDGFMELCSLLPKYFIEENIGNKLASIKAERYVLVRFVSWEASHDMTHKGLSLESKVRLINKLKEFGRVVISSESGVPDELKEYVYSAHPAEMHTVLKNAVLVVSESLTMAAESAFLGTPAICISTAQAGTLNEEVRLGLIELFRDYSSDVESRIIEAFKDIEYKEQFKQKVAKVLDSLIDPTAFMVWLVENYPESVMKLKEDPDYQYNFR